MKKIFVSCFDIGEVPKSPGKWNWNLFYFLSFIFTFELCEGKDVEKSKLVKGINVT